MRASVCLPQVSHHRCSWIVAPRSESTSEPAKPPAITATALSVAESVSGSQPVHQPIHDTTPIRAAPLRAANRPRRLTAPDVPAGTVLPVVIRRGRERLVRPISVLQVSALTAAIEPARSVIHMPLLVAA